MVSETEILNAKILIVDDCKDYASSLKDMLNASGYSHVTYTTDGREVRSLHDKNRYNLILLDLQMPEMDGFEVMKSLQPIESDAYLPVLAVTGEPAYKLQALKAGAKDFIAKPFDIEEVLTRIRNMLEVRLLHEEARLAATTAEILARHDPLTGLANRRLLIERVSAAIANARRCRSAMAVVFMDLDDFKQINDTLGHNVGDAFLKAVAERLKSVIREEDTAARLGGDEFVIALWNAGDVKDVATVASKLIHIVSQPYAIGNRVVTVTTSAGVSIYPVHGADVDTLMKTADTALYEAKRAGKNAFKILGESAAPVAARS